MSGELCSLDYCLNVTMGIFFIDSKWPVGGWFPAVWFCHSRQIWKSPPPLLLSILVCGSLWRTRTQKSRSMSLNEKCLSWALPLPCPSKGKATCPVGVSGHDWGSGKCWAFHREWALRLGAFPAIWAGKWRPPCTGITLASSFCNFCFRICFVLGYSMPPQKHSRRPEGCCEFFLPPFALFPLPPLHA